jgi:hypothetical protein
MILRGLTVTLVGLCLSGAESEYNNIGLREVCPLPLGVSGSSFKSNPMEQQDLIEQELRSLP